MGGPPKVPAPGKPQWIAILMIAASLFGILLVCIVEVFGIELSWRNLDPSDRVRKFLRLPERVVFDQDPRVRGTGKIDADGEPVGVWRWTENGDWGGRTWGEPRIAMTRDYRTGKFERFFFHPEGTPRVRIQAVLHDPADKDRLLRGSFEYFAPSGLLLYAAEIPEGGALRPTRVDPAGLKQAGLLLPCLLEEGERLEVYFHCGCIALESLVFALERRPDGFRASPIPPELRKKKSFNEFASVGAALLDDDAVASLDVALLVNQGTTALGTSGDGHTDLVRVDRKGRETAETRHNVSGFALCMENAVMEIVSRCPPGSGAAPSRK
jgi:hypothetical protein